VDFERLSLGARRHLPAFITAVVLLGFLAVAIKFMVDAWQHSTIGAPEDEGDAEGEVATKPCLRS
jgi:hypothetical protein